MYISFNRFYSEGVLLIIEASATSSSCCCCCWTDAMSFSTTDRPFRSHSSRLLMAYCKYSSLDTPKTPQSLSFFANGIMYALSRLLVLLLLPHAILVC